MNVCAASQVTVISGFCSNCMCHPRIVQYLMDILLDLDDHSLRSVGVFRWPLSESGKSGSRIPTGLANSRDQYLLNKRMIDVEGFF